MEILNVRRTSHILPFTIKGETVHHFLFLDRFSMNECRPYSIC